MKPWDRPSMKVLEGPMELFTRTLVLQFINQKDSHSVKRLGTPIFDIFNTHRVRQTRPYDVEFEECSDGAFVLD